MPWIQINVTVDEKKVKKVSSMLQGAGAQAVTYTDAKDAPIYEPPVGSTKLWHSTVVTGLFEADIDPFRIVSFVKKHFGQEVFCRVEQLEDKDWVREWMEYFKPMKFGSRLWICPSACSVPDPSAVNVMLDPGLAFGTGTHPTTAMCLEFLDGENLEGKTVIDYGCGSGILAVAALKLGAGEVVGIDIDPQAVEATLDNARRNDVKSRLQVYLTEDKPQSLMADVLVANILAGPLRELAEEISGLVKAGGRLALSGILETQAEELSQIYSKWFKIDDIRTRDEWARIVGTKK
ncbi:MAG: 50S ribosomal protein L11 methyltransferase [Succinivibrionaceae bacterium]|nr:50S ribosomal protein L11 methyltransferase [Succinivibrionaceae bacterium]